MRRTLYAVEMRSTQRLASLAAIACIAGCRGELMKDDDPGYALRNARIPGAPHEVDAIAILPVAVEQLERHPRVRGEPQLTRLRMVGVPDSGKMDLARCDGSLMYDFATHVGKDPALGAVTVQATGMFTPAVAPPDFRPVVGPPHCRVAVVRAAMVAAGVRDDPCTLQLEYRRIDDPEIGWFHGVGWKSFNAAGPVVVDDATCTVALPR